MDEDNIPNPTIRNEQKYDQSNIEMILRVRKYFDEELRRYYRINLRR